MLLLAWCPAFASVDLLPEEATWQETSQHQGLLGTYHRYQQMLHGVPVWGGAAVVRWTDGHPTLVRAHPKEAELAGFTAESNPPHPDATHPDATLFATADGPQWRVPSPDGTEVSWMDADGRLVRTESLLERASGEGLVFDPNPVATSNNTTLTDNDDAAQKALTAELFEVTLEHLDGTGALSGDWVDVTRPGDRTIEPSLVFDFDRDALGFEEVMVYFHVTRAQQRIQDLGFTDINNRPVPYVVDAFDDDYSFHKTGDLTIYMGSGGVDDAEDADVIIHEYAHSIHHNQVPGWGGGDQRSMGEGFGDYLAASFNETLSAQISDPACISDWDAVSYSSSSPPCLNRVDSDKHYPEDLAQEVHADGQMWSKALQDARAQLGADVMDRIVFEHHFGLTNHESFFTASDVLIQAALDLEGEHAADVVRRALIQTGVSRVLTDAPILEGNPMVIDQDLRVEGLNHQDDVQTITVPDAQALSVHFVRVDTETDGRCIDGACDNLYVLNGEGDLFAVLNASQKDVTVHVSGDTAVLRMVTDESILSWGYEVDVVTAYHNEILGHTGHPGTQDTAPANYEAPAQSKQTKKEAGCSSAPSALSWMWLVGVVLVGARRRSFHEIR